MKKRDKSATPAAIPTVYNGIQLKSRLEAQCAYLFDQLGWSWEYEPKSFMLPNGVAYTPDFFVSDHGLFVECRGYYSEKGHLQLKGFVDLISKGVDVHGTQVDNFLILSGNGTVVFQQKGMLFMAGLLCKCGDCGLWHIVFPRDFTFSCKKCHGRMVASAVITVNEGKILLNGADSSRWVVNQ